MSIKEVYSETLHSGCTVATQRASFNKVMLSNMFVLEVSTHCDLSLESSVAYRAMVWQAFGVGREMFCQMVLPEESLLTNATLVWFDASVTHFMAPHIRAI